MIKGAFIHGLPWIRVAMAYGRSVQASHFVLDTGFSGDLQVTSKVAKELGLKVEGIEPIRLASGELKDTPCATATAAMEDVMNPVQVLISEVNGMPVAGINFLSKFGYKAIVDCKNNTVVLEKA